MTDYGASDTSTTVLGNNQFPISEVFVPNGTLTALEGGPSSTDLSGKKSAPASMYVKDGSDVAQGTTTDAAYSGSGAGTTIALLKKLVAELAATLTVSGTITANAGTNLNTSTLALESGGHLAAIDTNTAASKTDLDNLNTALGAISDAAWSGSGNASAIAILKKIEALLAGTLTTSTSGTVTANAGTNLNTSLLALESGGNLASIKSDADAINTAIGAQADAAWSGSGSGSEIAILKKLVALLAATLTVSGSVSVSNFPGTQPVSGTVTANAGSGTFNNQQSNNTADYDSGAGTQTMTMFGVGLPASGGSVAGGTATNPFRTDPTGTTIQPVNGTVTANAGTNLNTSLLALESGGNLASIKTDADSIVTNTSNTATNTSNTSTVLGATADAAVTGDNTGSVSAKLRGLTKILADIWDSTNHLFHFNVKQVGGNAVATSASGVQKVGFVGNAGATVDSTVGAGSAPANAVATSSVYNSSAPAPTSGQAMAVQADQAGNTRTFPGIALAALSAWSSGTSLNATQTIFSNSGAPAVLVQVDQTTTITAGAITFEVTYDGTNWVTATANTVLDPTSATYAQISLPYTLQASTNKPFIITNNGWQGLRIKLSTQITGTGTVTPNYALLAYDPVDSAVVYSPTAANFQTTANQGGTWTVGSNSATGSAVPANAFYSGGDAATSLPTAASAGNLTGAMYDKFGRQVVLPGSIRDLRATQTTTISNSTSETTIFTAVSSVFLDVVMFIFSNTSGTATRIDIRDTTAGTVLGSVYVPAGDMRGFAVPGETIPQTSVNTNWTATCATAVTDIRVYALVDKNK